MFVILRNGAYALTWSLGQDHSADRNQTLRISGRSV